MDKFSASLLLAAAMGAPKSGTSLDQMANLYKDLNKDQGGPSPEARMFVEQHMGKKCKITGTSHEGIIHKLNDSTSGFYPGSRYPVYVKITNGDSTGQVFEYDLSQIELLE